MSKKTGNLSIRLDKDLLEKYKSHCDKNGYDMSKRLRIFIESEIPIDYDLIKIDDIIFEPIESEFEIINIMGFNFASIKSKPKVFIIKTESKITDNITFYHKGKNYKLEGVSILKKESSDILIECKKWIVEYTG